MLASLLLVLGIAVLGMAFRSFANPAFQRLGILCILATSFLIGYLPSGSWICGVIVASIWVFLPWLDILTKIRVLKMPVERQIRHKNPPNRELFPNLDELTVEIEAQGFEAVDDVGCDWETQEQFLRIFHREADQTQAAVCLIDQGDIAFYYVSVMTRTSDDQQFTTWNYPFSYSLKFLPKNHILRVKPDSPFKEMCAAHEKLLRKAQIAPDQIKQLDPDQIRDLLQQDLVAQIRHNVRAGLLTPVDNEKVRYTWRGMVYLWLQFLWDFVRL
jgi:hypothetical protein